MISLLNKFDDNYVINEKDVLEIASYYLTSNSLTDYLKDIIFDDKSTHLVYYNPIDNTILLNNERIWKYCYKNADRVKNDYRINDRYYNYFLNFYYFSVIFHELTHALQKMNYEKAKSDSLYAYLYDLCKLLQYTNIAFYNKNHDLLPLEIDATNNGFFKAYQLMTYTNLPSRDAQIMHLEYLKSLLNNYRRLNKYKVITPLDKLYSKNPIIDIEEIYKLMDQEKISKMQRLNFGLDITPKEYDSINKEKMKILLRR